MTLYYSFKELVANFSSMWKVLLYRLIVLIISISVLIGLAQPTLTYIYDQINRIDFFTNIAGFFNSFWGNGDLAVFGGKLSENFVQIGKILLDNIGRLVLTYVYIVLTLCLSRFLNCIADYAITDVIGSNMAANVKLGFVPSIFANLGKAVKFSLVKVMFTVPIDAIVLALGIVMFVTLFSPLGLFMPFLVALIIILLVSFRLTIFTGWLPSVVCGNNIFSGLKSSVKSVFKNFWQVFSSWIMFCIFFMLSLPVVGFFTFGVGVIVLFPFFIMLSNIYHLVFDFNRENKRFYIDHETIVTPKGLYDEELVTKQ